MKKYDPKIVQVASDGFNAFLKRRLEVNLLPKATEEELKIVYYEGFLNASDYILKFSREVFSELAASMTNEK